MLFASAPMIPLAKLSFLNFSLLNFGKKSVLGQCREMFTYSRDPSIGEDVDTIWPAYEWASQKYLQFGNSSASESNLTTVKDHLQSNEVVFWSRELGLFDEGKGLNVSVGTCGLWGYLT